MAKEPFVESPSIVPDAPRRRAQIRPEGRDQMDGREPQMDVRHAIRAGAVTAIGRDGQILTRAQPDNDVDDYYVDPRLIPAGWAYQWNYAPSKGVFNDTDVTRRHALRMAANGWTPVPASRHPGTWTPLGHEGDIIVGALRLEERPASLNEEAKNDNLRKAAQQVRDRDEALMGGKASLRKSMGGGFEMDNKYRGAGADLRMSIDRSLDGEIPRPVYQSPED